MCTLAHIFEAAGIATVAFGSIRQQMIGTAPPRGLACDFPLGRPIGKPNDAEFRHKVLAQAFSMLKRTGPGVEDFPEFIPDAGTELLTCPLPPRHDPDVHPAVDEARGLRAAYDRAIEKYGNRVGAAVPTMSHLPLNRSFGSARERRGKKRRFPVFQPASPRTLVATMRRQHWPLSITRQRHGRVCAGFVT